jgi:hypothetical protein
MKKRSDSRDFTISSLSPRISGLQHRSAAIAYGPTHAAPSSRYRPARSMMRFVLPLPFSVFKAHVLTEPTHLPADHSAAQSRRIRWTYPVTSAWTLEHQILSLSEVDRPLQPSTRASDQNSCNSAIFASWNTPVKHSDGPNRITTAVGIIRTSTT